MLAYASDNGLHPFLEPAILLVAELLAHDAALLAHGSAGMGASCALVPTAPILLELAGHPDVEVAGSAAACLAALCTQWPADAAPWVLTTAGATLLCKQFWSLLHLFSGMVSSGMACTNGRCRGLPVLQCPALPVWRPKV